MQTIYRLKASELDDCFLEGLKATFQDKEIEIIVYEVDETDYLLKSAPNKTRLLKAIENVDHKTNLVEVNLENKICCSNALINLAISVSFWYLISGHSVQETTVVLPTKSNAQGLHRLTVSIVDF